MKVIFAALADAANFGERGKMNLLGLFRVISVKDFPSTVAQMALAVQFLPSANERDKTFKIRVVLVGSSNTILWQAPEEVTAHLRVKPEIPSTPNLPPLAVIFQIVGVTLPESGDYRFQIQVDRVTIHELPFEVTKIRPRPAPPQQTGATHQEQAALISSLDQPKFLQERKDASDAK